MTPVVTAAEMREIDRLSIERYGIPGHELMEHAGMGAVELILERFPRQARDGVVLLAGKGNNGGDALVMARLLHEHGFPCRVFLAADPGLLTGDAAMNLERWQRGARSVEVLDGNGLGTLGSALRSCGLAVDALFGTGLKGKLREPGLSIVSLLNTAPCPIVSVDVPSGLDADLGVALGDAVRATVTVTFAFPKVGLLVHPGAEYAGEIRVVDIGVSQEAVADVVPRQELLTEPGVGAILPVRVADSHKGSHGHVAVVGGSPEMAGAVLLAGRAGLRAGAGLVTVVTAAEALDRAATPELMIRSVPLDWARAEGALDDVLARKSVVVFGPGLGASESTPRLARWLLEHVMVPLVIDADGLNALVGRLHLIRRSRAEVILTPHPGEAGRLLGSSAQAVQADRIGAVRELAKRTNATVVLKGARTLVAGADGLLAINPTGNPGMATGGMGDVLAGICGALLAQGLGPADAARAAVFWHGYAADLVAARLGTAGLLATDVIEELPPARRNLERAAMQGR